jgi:sensor histidine kinase YesM
LTLNFSHDNDHITIEICDNGKGFDVERVMGIMQGKIETGKHFGLPHTFSRIQHYYGMDKAKIELSSEPYYRNMFRLIVPYIGIDEKN